MKKTIALMLVLSLLVFGLTTTANALIVLDEGAPDDVGVDGEVIAEDATPDEAPPGEDEEPGVDGEGVAEDATPGEGETPAGGRDKGYLYGRKKLK